MDAPSTADPQVRTARLGVHTREGKSLLSAEIREGESPSVAIRTRTRGRTATLFVELASPPTDAEVLNTLEATLRGQLALVETFLNRVQRAHACDVRMKKKMEEEVEVGALTRLQEMLEPVARFLDNALHVLVHGTTVSGYHRATVVIAESRTRRCTVLRDAFERIRHACAARPESSLPPETQAALERVRRLACDAAATCQQVIHLSRNQERIRGEIADLLSSG